MSQKSGALGLSGVREVFRLLGDVRESKRDPLAARKRICDGLCRITGAVHAFTLDLEGMIPGATLDVKQMVIGGHPDEKGLRYLFEFQQHKHQYIDPTTTWAVNSRAKRTAARTAEMFCRRVWDEHPYFNEHFRPAGLGDLLIGFYRRKTPGSALGFSLARAKGDRTFTSRDRTLLDLFVKELDVLRAQGQFDIDAPPTLTARQNEVFKLLLQGLSIKQVARRLAISRHTADDHAKAIYQKLDVHSRGELLARHVTM